MLFLVIMIMVSGGVILLPTASSLFKTSINLYQNHTQGELLLCNVKYLTMPFAYDIILFIGQVKYGIKRPLELISGFSKMKNKKINAQKPRDFYTTAVIMLWTNKSNPIHNGYNNQVPGIRLTKDVKGFYHKNYETLMKQMKKIHKNEKLSYIYE